MLLLFFKSVEWSWKTFWKLDQEISVYAHFINLRGLTLNIKVPNETSTASELASPRPEPLPPHASVAAVTFGPHCEQSHVPSRNGCVSSARWTFLMAFLPRLVSRLSPSTHSAPRHRAAEGTQQGVRWTDVPYSSCVFSWEIAKAEFLSCDPVIVSKEKDAVYSET